MKCRTCTICEHYTLYPTPDQGDEPIELVECPLGDKAFHLADKRCSKAYIRRELERSINNEEQDSKID